MRVYFAPCGIGLGHVGRTVPIAKRLIQRNAEVIFSTYKEGISYIEKEQLPLVKAPPIGFKVKPDGTVDFRQTAMNPGPFLASFTALEQVNAEIESIQKFSPDVVVSDSRASPLIAAEMLGLPRICILNQFQVIIPRRKKFLRLAKFADFATLTLIGKIWTSGNTVLIPDFPEPYTVSVGNLGIPKSYRKNVILIGPILQTQPDELPKRDQLRRKLKLPLNKPVIFVPLSGPVEERLFLSRLLKKIFLDFPEEYEVIMSFGSPNAQTRPERNGNLIIHEWIPNRFEYLKACDLTISRAGHGTITQCMCYGKPMILIPTPNHTEQLSNAKRVANLGVADIILQEAITKQELLQRITHVLQSDVRERLEETKREVARYSGLENAVDAIVRAAEE